MEYIEKDEKSERIYSVHYDREKLKELLDEIIRKASIRTEGKFTAPENAKYEGNTFISGAELPNGDPKYENIKSIYRFTSTGTYSYHNDSIAVEGTLVTAPFLARIIAKILSDEPESIYDFLSYPNDIELIPIDERIEQANKKVDEISNFEFNKKIQAINHLKKLCENKNNKFYFNVELLKQYYLKARCLFEIELLSEKTIKNGGRVKLNDFKPLN